MTSRVTLSARPSVPVAELSLARSSATWLAASASAWPAAPPTSSRARARTSNFLRKQECSFALTTPSPCRSQAPAAPRSLATAAEARQEVRCAAKEHSNVFPRGAWFLGGLVSLPFYFFGKFGSAFTSLICLVCL